MAAGAKGRMMLTIARADTTEDYAAAARFCRELAELDVAHAKAIGIPHELVIALFHSGDDDLRQIYAPTDTRLFVATWAGSPAGCLGLMPFADTEMELKKFFVDPAFRGKGVGRALIDRALSEARDMGCGTVVLQTAVYLESAIRVYEAAGFARCAPFRPVPNELVATDVFMRRAI